MKHSKVVSHYRGYSYFAQFFQMTPSFPSFGLARRGDDRLKLLECRMTLSPVGETYLGKFEPLRFIKKVEEKVEPVKEDEEKKKKPSTTTKKDEKSKDPKKVEETKEDKEVEKEIEVVVDIEP